MRFYLNYEQNYNKGKPIYIKKENSFLFEPWENCGFSITLGEMYVGLDVEIKNKLVVQLSGFSPKATWEKRQVSPPNSIKGNLYVSDVDILSGTGVSYSEKWKSFYDKKSGWILFSNQPKDTSGDYVMFANNTIASIIDGCLVAVWVKPDFV